MLTVESRWWIYEYTLHNSFNFSGMWWGDRLQEIRCFHSEQLKVRNNMTLMGLPIRTMSTVHYDARVRGDSNFNLSPPVVDVFRGAAISHGQPAGSYSPPK